MSLFPSPFLAKLQDLKLWQGNYEALLQNKSTENNNPSDFDTIEGLSALDSTRSSVDMNEKHMSTPQKIEWDKKVVTPSKPFEQLLEEKLAEDQPVVVPVKPKKPFLRKGAGLTRYRMSYPQNIKFVRKTIGKLDSKRTLASVTNAQRKVSPRHENCFRDQNIENSSSNFKNIPLTIPNISMKPKGVWVNVQQNDTDCQTGSKFGNEIEEEFKDKQGNFMERISELALRHLKPTSSSKTVYKSSEKL